MFPVSTVRSKKWFGQWLILADIDGIGGAALLVLHKGIEVQCMPLPFVRNRCTDKTDRTGYRGNKQSFALVGTEDEQIELVVLVLRGTIAVESNANHTFLIHVGRGDAETGHGALADQYAGIVDAVGTKAVLVEPLENTVGVEFLTHSQIVKPYLVTLLHG